MIKKTRSTSAAKDRLRRHVCSAVWIWLCLISIVARNAVAAAAIDPPVLISQETSTRAIVLESLCLTSEPFALASPCSWDSDRRTRITLFALDLSLQPGENLSVVTADAEDAVHRHYDLTVEYVGPVPHQEWISAVVLRLNDNLGDVGDVLVRVSYRGISSNRVRIGIGHSGGGPPDDPGAVPTPVRPYAVAGQIRDDNNQMLDGIEVTLADNTDGTIRRTTSSNGGQFSFSAPAGHSFTVTPTTTPIFSFNAQNINVLSSDRVLNWKGTRRTYSIAGRLANAASVGIRDVVINLSGSQSATTTSDSNGNYAFTTLAAGRDYAITASTTPYYTFTPQSFSSLSGDQIANFAGELRSYTVNGSVQLDHNPAASIEVLITGSQNTSITTDVNGRYSSSLPAGGSYTITPLLTYYDFTPASLVLADLNSDRPNSNFNATRQRFTIGGKLRDQNGNSLAGMSVSLTGAQLGSTITDGSGNYQFTALPAGFDYVVTPSITSLFTFDPQPVQMLAGNRVLDFQGTRRPNAISGRLIDSSGSGIGGTWLVLNGTQYATVLTDSTGYYWFGGLTTGGNYTVTLESPYYSCPAQQINNLGGTETANFTGTLRRYTLAGRAQLGPYPAVDLEVTINGSVAASTRTDINGVFSFGNLPAKGNYTLGPSLRYYDFSPASETITDLKSDTLTYYFVGTRQTFAISGKLSDQEGNGLSGMAINLTGAEQRATVSDNTGHYQFANLPAGFGYALTPPSTAAYTFTGQNIAELSGNQVLDFLGLRRLQLSGRVLDHSGNGLIGIKVTLTGSESSTAITAADGSYFLMATATGNYAVTPSLAQDYYTFAPASAQFNNLASAHTTDFSATLAPLPNPSYVLEFDGTPKTVDYGNFWPENVNLGHFFWEFWARPGGGAGATYMLSDGYGGAHALLFGVGSFNSSEPNRYELLGNIFDGVRFDNYFGSDQGPAVGEWAHFAVGWDGQSIITYYNGVPVGKTPFAGPRRTPGPGGGGGRLLIGGSDHSNFDGRIAQVRGYEDTNPREGLPGGVEASFAPQTVFSLEGNLLSYYFRSGGVNVPDLSQGYNGANHGGWLRGTTAGVIFDCGGCPPPQFVIDPSAPNFATNTPPAPVSTPTPAAVPGGALVYDSFSRENSTYLFGSQGGLGSTEGGSSGTRVWQTNQTAGSPQPFGILNSIAVLLANDVSLAWVQTGSATGNVDVRCDRRRGRWGRGLDTGLSFRVVDAGNFFFAYTSTAGGSGGSQLLKVGYYANGQRTDLTTGVALPANWSTLDVITQASGDVKVYADGVLVYSTNNPLLATATGAGLYNNSAGLGLLNRWDNFTVLNAQ